MRSGSSVGANYRAACRARSRRDSSPRWALSKKKQTNRSTARTSRRCRLLTAERVDELRDHARHIVAMTVLSIRARAELPFYAARRTPHAAHYNAARHTRTLNLPAEKLSQMFIDRVVSRHAGTGAPEPARSVARSSCEGCPDGATAAWAAACTSKRPNLSTLLDYRYHTHWRAERAAR